jgi:DNA-binding IclR family transcriptional regulator
MLKQHPRKFRSYDEEILNLLKELSIPLPLNFISFATGIPKDRACKVCKSLLKWKFIKRSTISSASFYEARK